MILIPRPLLDAIKDQRVVLFLGAGASLGAKHPEGKEIPQGDQLRDLISDQFLEGKLKKESLQVVAAMAGSEAGLSVFQAYIRDLFSPFGPADFHFLIPKFRWRAIATTNFDLIVEKAYADARDPLQNLVKAVKNSDGLDTRINKATDPVAFFKLHGCIEYVDDPDIPLLLSLDQFTNYEENRDRFYKRFHDLGYENSVIFAGYSISDLHILGILSDLTSPEISRPPYYLISPHISDIQNRYWTKRQVHTIQTTFEGFLNSIDQSIPSLARVIPPGFGGGELSIRNRYLRPQASEPASVRSFLTNDVTHVFSGLSARPQDPREFYRGYDNGWGCITQQLSVRRSFSDSVLSDSILVEEEKRQSVELFMLKGPGGNGKTVALKSIAWEASTKYDNLVLYTEVPAGLNIEPLSEIHRLTGERIFLFVDRVAIVRNELLELLQAAQSLSMPLSIIGAERVNEWNIYCEHLEQFLRQEFHVRYLNEQEIEELLGLLEQHGALGLLRNLSFEERVSKFVERAERQLLVALHEATLGVPFEDIIVDEFKRIQPDAARTLYLYICALHQFDAPVRAGLISRASGINFEQFQRRFLQPLEKIIHVVKDGHNRDLSYRSRHQHVAEIVFGRMLPSGKERFALLAKLLKVINIDYSSDNETFSRLIKGRGITEIFSDVELGRQFYSLAEEAVPNRHFVFHQRAVFEMQHRFGSLEKAQAAAAHALDLNSNSHSIRHTQAEIARRLANETDDPLLKRSLRQTAQGKLGGSDRYNLVTRALLALDEFRDLAKSTEMSDDEPPRKDLVKAIEKVETAIQSGIQLLPESPELLSVEATFRESLNETSRAVQALERAVDLNPSRDHLAVRLARKYEEAGELEKSKSILEKCLLNNPSSKPAHLRLGHVLVKTGERSRAIDHLRLSFTTGDDRYDAQFWYARELYIQGEYDEASKRFRDLHKYAPPRFRIHPAATWERDATAIVFECIVRHKEEDYAFVKVSQFPKDIYAPRPLDDSADWDSLYFRANAKCSIAFNWRGPCAISLRLTG